MGNCWKRSIHPDVGELGLMKEGEEEEELQVCVGNNGVSVEERSGEKGRRLFGHHGGSLEERTRLCRTRMGYQRYAVNFAFQA